MSKKEQTLAGLVGNQTVTEFNKKKKMDASNCLVTNVLQNILFYVQHEKETQTGLEQLEGKQMTIYILGLAMPLNILFSHLSLYFTTTLELLYYYGIKQYA